MTDPTRPTDEELAGRIRRSLDHYRLEAPLPNVVEVRPGPVWRAATLLAASLAGAVVTMALLGAFNGLRSGPGVGGPPASSEPTADSSDLPESSAPQPTAKATPIPESAAAERCLMEDGLVPDEWLRGGESEEQVRAHIRGLPLLVEERRDFGSLFVYADERFVAVCTFEPSLGAVPDFTRFHMLRETLIDSSLGTGSSFSSGGSVDAEGKADPGDPPNLLLQGWASAEVGRVEGVLEDGATVPAPLADGVWVAWWQRPVGSVAIRAYSLDGRLMDEVMHELTVPAPIGPDGVVDPTIAPAPRG